MGRKQKNRRIERPLVAFAVAFIAVIILLILFILYCSSSTAETVILAICCAALAFVPIGIFYLLHGAKKNKGSNPFTYDYNRNRDRLPAEVSDDEILEKLDLYMGYALSYETESVKSRIRTWINKRYGGIPNQFRNFLPIQILRLAMRGNTGAELDLLFRDAPKLYFDKLVEELYQIHADELAKNMQYFRAIYSEHPQEVTDALKQASANLDSCVACYIRTNIDQFK